MPAFDTATIGPKMILPALLAAAAGGAAYGVASSYVPYIKLKVFMIMAVTILTFALFSLIGRNVFLNRIIGLLGGVIAILAFWFGWYWIEFRQDAALEFINSGPWGVYKPLMRLSQTYVYITGDFGGDNGTMMTQIIWGGETALFFLTPVLGSLFARTRALRGART